MKGDCLDLFRRLTCILEDLDNLDPMMMIDYTTMLNYNEICAAQFALKKLMAERNKVENG